MDLEKMCDLYFLPQYGELNEFIEEGENVIYNYNSELGNVYHMFIKRKIDVKVDNETWHDLITPYGYGGPVIYNCKEADKKALTNEYFDDFRLFCNKNNIVSEFIRFHPLIENAKDFSSIYEIENFNKTIGTNLKDHEEPYKHEFSASCRKNIRKILRKGVSYKITTNPDNLSNFKKIYYSTMDRNDAKEFYYFSDEYFEYCINNLKENIVLIEAVYDEMTIAMGMYFIYDKTIHIHLSGTINEYYYLSPAYILRYGITIWGKENGYELIHHGGGITNSPDDGLYKFKKRFGSLQFDFYIGKKIWKTDIYEKLVNLRMKEKTPLNESFFPLYRA